MSFNTEQLNLIVGFAEWLEENAIAKTQGGQVPNGKRYVWRTPKIASTGYIGGFTTKELWQIYLSKKEDKQ